MQLKWIGARKNRTIELPVPFESRSTKEGEIHFTPYAEVTDELANALLAQFPGSFEKVGPTRPVAAPDPEPVHEATVSESEPDSEGEEIPVPDSLKRKPGRPRRTTAIPA